MPVVTKEMVEQAYKWWQTEENADRSYDYNKCRKLEARYLELKKQLDEN